MRHNGAREPIYRHDSVGGKIRWKEFCAFHENTGFTLTLLEKDPYNSKFEESSENWETFSWSKFIPATGVKNRPFTPSTQSNLFPKLICFFYVETHKVSTSIRGGFDILLHKTFLEQVHSARLSCTADTRPLNEFEKGPNLAENRVEYVVLTTWDGNSIFFSANRARPGSQKLPLNGFTEWNSDKNKEKAYQKRE